MQSDATRILAERRHQKMCGGIFWMLDGVRRFCGGG
jgi:hypothetical protein